MSDPKAPSFIVENLVTSPGPERGDEHSNGVQLHRGVEVRGENGEEGPKAFYIHIEALPGKEGAVLQMLRDIYGYVLGEPATGPWFGVRYSATTFGIFEAFPSIAGRDAHVAGGGGDIFRDRSRMNEILVYPAQVHRVDVLLVKELFGR
ncbi:hypothetical protein ACNFH8_02615 [Pseudomonas sp. NY15436]|uniref:hypothetical protein n=1 Tax=Pseudomonas sp. NY15436 TaxID=3400359 RepID=UPI003A87DA4C